MGFRFERHARRRSLGAALAGVALVTVFGPLLTVPAIALVALVYYSHQVAAAVAGDVEVPYPSLAFVIVLNASAILLVQVVVFLANLQTPVA